MDETFPREPSFSPVQCHARCQRLDEREKEEKEWEGEKLETPVTLREPTFLGTYLNTC